MVDVYIGLGANQGDVIQQILDAKRKIVQQCSTHNTALSSLYWSAPVGYTDQADFVNAVLRCSVSCSPPELLVNLQQIERGMGRIRDPQNQNAPRTIDLDILVFDEQFESNESLTLPHPRMFERRFVLLPLIDVMHAEHVLYPQVQSSLQALKSVSGQVVQAIVC